MKRITDTFRTAGIAALFTVAALPVWAVELIMVEQPGCVYCAAWDLEISEAYPKTPEGSFAPLRRMQITETRRGSAGIFTRPVNYTPTFVLVENGHELARIEGYPGAHFFWGLLEMMLKQTTEYQGENG